MNIQSHGPYDTGSYSGSKTYLNGKYSMECKNAMNNYMDSIMDSDVQLIKMLDKLKYDSEPVVVVLYSDHLPWMGDGKIFYEELGINLDLSTEEGFRNHYTTDYLIWANDKAKNVLSKEFKGKGPTISPFYLMNQLMVLYFLLLSYQIVVKIHFLQILHHKYVIVLNFLLYFQF